MWSTKLIFNVARTDKSEFTDQRQVDKNQADKVHTCIYAPRPPKLSSVNLSNYFQLLLKQKFVAPPTLS